MIELGVNIDHVATLRQARKAIEPDPVWAAAAAQVGGADLITVHLREDRRHIQDQDVRRVKEACQVRLNLEMAATAEMVDIACQIKPYMCTLVPEGRMEVTTEGGLNVLAAMPKFKDVAIKLHDHGIRVSAFIDPVPRQAEGARDARMDMCEIHTGPYAAAYLASGGDLRRGPLSEEMARIIATGERIGECQMRFNAGHALNYVNVIPIAALANLSELHIGHAIVSRALFVGITQAVREMKTLMRQAVLERGR